MGTVRALLVQPSSPSTYWSFEHALPFIGKSATMPPLGLATLAALLPAGWRLRLRDLHLAPLDDADLRWADAVLLTGMLVQATSMRAVLARARALGRRTVVGGPAASTSPGLFPEADHVFVGEAEGRLGLLVDALQAPDRRAPRVLSPDGEARPDLALAPVPRFDLVDLPRYANLALQYSRGCPYRCEFCDIIEIFGRVPRVKSPEQVLAELEALHRLGARGSLFLVDDNFVGNRREVARLLPALEAWQRRHGFPFQLLTEASLDLAAMPELVEAMARAGFEEVFLGVETPSAQALREAGKGQNLRMPLEQAITSLTRAGLEVFGGFIVGFDSDGPDIFDRQLDFISRLPVPRAMLGLLSALPGTRLWHRLEAEGRLRGEPSGDQFDRPNFEPAMDERTLLEGYRRLLGELYAPGPYYRRAGAAIDQLPFRAQPGAAGAVPEGALRALAAVTWRLGIAGRRRRHFWRLLARASRRGVRAMARAVTLAVMGESLIRYTEETVLPRLDRALAAVPAAAGERAPARPPSGHVGGIPGRPQPLVQRVERGQVLGVQPEAEDVGVLHDPLPPHRLGDGDQAVLQPPAHQHLGHGAAVAGRHAAEHRVVHPPAADQRPVGLELDAVAPAVLEQRPLVEEGVELHLVHRRRLAGPGQQLVEVGHGVVGDPDGPRLPVGQEPLHGPPGVEALPLHRPVDQVEVGLLDPQPPQAGVAGPQRGLVPVIGVPELGGDEEVAAREAAGLQRRPHVLLVPVGARGVHVPVAGLERPADGVAGLGAGRGLPEAEAEHGHGDAAAQRDGGVGGGDGHPDLGDGAAHP
jgi:radical SAM superfamily enzyme YgiQ (UPF0313 family)